MSHAHSACIGRFAPSPTGPLHAGSLVAALASWLDVRAHDGPQRGRWLLRIEDVDTPRCVPGADELILQQLAACGLVPDEPPVWQSQRTPMYARALERLIEQGQAYACTCTRADIARAHAEAGRIKPRHGELVYPGTCRQQAPETAPHAWRLQVPLGDAGLMRWDDRRLGSQSQALDEAVGDFVIKRSDGLWAYQLAVVVDDAEQGVTHIVRGEDLADNTPRQVWLQHCLGLPTPAYLHTPLVCGLNGEKLSKQNGADALDLRHPVQALSISAQHLARKMDWQPPPSVLLGTILTDWLTATVAWWRDQVALNGVT